jgi:type VI secretion system secreted protein VgrG
MGAKFELAIPIIMKHEGGWVNDSADLGKETNFGWSTLTIKRLKLTEADLGIPGPMFVDGYLKPMKKEKAEELYRKYFWDNLGYSNVNDQKVSVKLMDSAVNMGPKRAAEFAQRACNTLGANPQLTVDGSLGPKSFAAINACDPQKFVNAFADEMTAYYERIIKARPANAKFRRNWLKRAQWGVV